MRFGRYWHQVVSIAAMGVLLCSCRENKPAKQGNGENAGALATGSVTPAGQLSGGDLKSTASEPSRKLDPDTDWPAILDLARRDLPAAVALFDGIDSERRGNLLVRLVSDLASENLEKLPELLKILPNSQCKLDAMQLTAANWEKDVDRLIRFAGSQPSGELKNIAYKDASDALIRQGGFTEVATLLNQMPFSTYRDHVAEFLAQQWANKDPDSAVAWVKGLDAQDRKAASGMIIEGLAERKDIDALVKFANEFPDDQVQAQAVYQIAQLIPVNADPNAAQQWVNSLSKPLQKMAITALVAAHGESDPAGWSAYVANHVDNGADRRSMVENLTAQMVHDDPAKAAKFAVGLQDSAEKGGAIAAVVLEWYGLDAAASSAWVASLPEGPDKNTALLSLLPRINNNDPDTAKAMAAKVTDPAVRQRIQNIISQ
jgi:hypothetical protein